MNGNPTFRELLKREEEVALGAYIHQDLPFEKLVEELVIERNLNHAPIFQVMFAFNNTAQERLAVNGLELESLELRNRFAKFDLMLSLQENNEGLSGALEYNTDLFDEATIRRMAGHFRTLLESVVREPDTRVRMLSLLEEDEQQQLVFEWNRTATDFDLEQCLHTLFEARAAQIPDAIALTCEGEQLSYGELNRQANQLAHYLRASGVESEVCVGILLERSIEMVVAQLAILKAGAAYVPLDPELPLRRLGFLIDDAEVRIIITTWSLGDSLPSSALRVIRLEDTRNEISAASDENPKSVVTPANLAYVIYTSGSTGQPKGVMVTHRSVVNHLLWRQAAYPLSTTDCFLQKASYSFDISVWEIFATLLSGARLVIAKPGGHRDSVYLAKLIEEQQVTVAHFGPAMLQAFLFVDEVDGRENLQRVFCGGEPLSVELQDLFFARLRANLHNQYGPTETCIDVTAWDCTKGETRNRIPIGRPIANTQIHVLDDQFQCVPIGVPGELCVAGVAVARGYLNRPELTAERFVPNPFSEEPGSRMFRTGDQGRLLAGGEIEFLGRLDNQVKIRGYRVELGEIEATLVSHTAVLESAVIAHGTSPADKFLVGFVVTAPEHKVATEELRDYLQARLPEYMIPTSFVMLERLPLTSSGKIDRQALLAFVPERPQSSREFMAPRSLVEEFLCRVWEEFLKVEQVGIHDNFFELGGHSLIATQVMSRLRRIFHVEVPLRLLFEAPTVAGLGRAIERLLRGGGEVEAPPLMRASRGGELPLSYAQQRLWFLEQMEPGNAYYNIPVAVRLRGTLEVGALERSFAEVVRRHEALRTRFREVGGQAVQEVMPWEAGLLRVAVEDLSGLSATEQEAEVARQAEAAAGQGFDLREVPLLRVRLLRLGAEEYVLILTMHHIVSDGWSVGVLVEEVGKLYEGYVSGAESPLAELGIQYGDYAVWQREWLQGAVLAEQVEYWREQLRGAPGVLELPTDRPRPKVQSYRGAREVVRLERELTERLQELSRGEGATLFMTLLAAFKVLLSRYTGQKNIVVGAPVANRQRQEVEGLIGCFVNTLVLRTDLSGDPSFGELLQRVREVTLGAYTHQDMPFEQLVEELQPKRDLSHSPLFQVMFAFNQTPRDRFVLSTLETEQFDVENRSSAKFDLSWWIQESGDSLTAALEYNTDLFDKSTAVRIAENFEVLLRAIVSDPSRPISRLPLMTAEEQRQVLVEWNETAADFGAAVCVHELIEAAAARRPEAMALLADGQELSYGELNERANQLAHYLRRQGVGPDVRVGILLERSVEMVVALLGTLKAGGAYVPLDPEYPAERLAYMLADAGIKLVLTQESVAQRPALSSFMDRNHLELIMLDGSWSRFATESVDNVVSGVTPSNLAYVIYTSGSTGMPKGVMVSHANVANFFSAMDERLGGESPGRWLAVTSISFDISVLELLWTLTRGFEVIVQGEKQANTKIARLRPPAIEKEMAFSLFYFASDESSSTAEAYRLLIEGAKFADAHEFKAIWTPERHFHAFGGLYPNPSVTSAAIATITRHIQIRAGSVVLPLHNPVRVAEEWSVVDNLSNGRVGISFASGWHANDFVFAPHNYADRHKIMYRDIDTVRSLWRGEAITLRGGGGNEVQIKISPRPIQPELPIWVTAAGNPQTFESAGRLGANLLTHLLGQSIDDLKHKIERYRAAWREAGHGLPEGQVTLMLHTFVGPDLEYVRQQVRAPFTNYLRSSISLIKDLARSLGLDINSDQFTEEDMQVVLDHAFNRYFETSGLMGTPEQCLQTINKLKAAGVDEIACLIDFGVEVGTVLSSLPLLDELRRMSNRPPVKLAHSYSGPARNGHDRITHLQCTPSMAGMLAADEESLQTLKSLDKLMVGGEALPYALAKQLREELPGEIHNMYGPTETTIWSASHKLENLRNPVPIGRPVANTQLRIFG